MNIPFEGLLATLDIKAPIASLDFETFYDSKRGVSIKELGNWAYCHHPEWDAYLVTCRRARFDEDTKTWVREETIIRQVADFDWNLLRGHRVYAHNAGFDHTVLRTLAEQGAVPADLEASLEGFDCTADFTSYLCNRRALKDAVLFLFKKELSKEVRTNADGKRWPEGFTPEEREAMLAYAGDDADWCLELAILAQKYWPDSERLISRLNRLQGMRGVRLDRRKLEILMAGARNMEIECRAIIPWVHGEWYRGMPSSPKKPGPLSNTQYHAYCREHGLPLPPVKSKVGEELFLEWEAEHSADHPVIAAVQRYRSVSKILDALEALHCRMDENDIFRFSIKYAGAHTLRFSGDSGFNMQNMLKADAKALDADWMVLDAAGNCVHAGPLDHETDAGYIEEKAEYEAACEAAKLAKTDLPAFRIEFTRDDKQYILLDIRSLFLARPGNRLLIADSAQIEPRCLAYLAGDRPFIEAVKAGSDPYEAHARVQHGFKGEIGLLKKLEKMGDRVAAKLRKCCKAERIGLGYQAGKVGFKKAAVTTAGLILTDEEAQEAVSHFRANGHCYVRYWDMMQKGFEACLGRVFKMRLPSGRIMSYRAVAKEKDIKPDPRTGNPVIRWVFRAEADGARKIYYGGKLTENITQATARDVFVYYMLAAWDRALAGAKAAGLSGYSALTASLDEAPLFSVHDELVIDASAEHILELRADIEAIMRTTPEWMGDTPFEVESVISPYYLK